MISLGLSPPVYPPVAIPITGDQPGVAARIARTGTGLTVPLAECDPARLHAASLQVLREARFAAGAKRFQSEIARSNGLSQAADIIEEVLVTVGPCCGPTTSALTDAQCAGLAVPIFEMLRIPVRTKTATNRSWNSIVPGAAWRGSRASF